MDFRRRAESALEREEHARALMILVRGLRGEPDDEEAFDLFLFIYTRHIDQPGMEAELFRGLEFYDRREEMLGFAVEELHRLDKSKMARAIETEARDREIEIVDPEPPEDLAAEDEGKGTAADDSEVAAASGIDEPSAPEESVRTETGKSVEDDEDPATDDRGEAGGVEDEEETDDESNPVEDSTSESKKGRRGRLFAVGLAGLIVVIAASVGLVGWEHARDAQTMVAVDEAMIALDLGSVSETREVLEDAKSGIGSSREIEERLWFVESLMALEGGTGAEGEERGEPSTSWGLAAAAFRATDAGEWEEAVRLMRHLERAHGETLPAFFIPGRICEARGQWDCAAEHYHRVQRHFEGFVPARTGLLRIAAARFDGEAWHRKQADLKQHHGEGHPYSGLPWIDPFDHRTGDGEVSDADEKFEDDFISRWRAKHGLVESLRDADWETSGTTCDEWKVEPARRLPVLNVLCAQAKAGLGEVEEVHRLLTSAVADSELDEGFYRQVQIWGPRLLTDLGRADMGLSLAIPFETPLEETDEGLVERAAASGETVPAHFRAPGDEMTPKEAEALLARGRTLVSLGATRRARRTIAPLVGRPDAVDPARFELVRSHLIEGNRESGKRVMEQIDDEAVAEKARIYLAFLEGRHADAYQGEVPVDDDPFAVRIRALAYLADGRGRAATRALEEAKPSLKNLALRPVRYRVFSRAGAGKTVDSRWKKPGDGESATTIDVLIDLAAAAFWNRDLEASARRLQRVLDAVEHHPEANWNMGLVRRSEGDDRQARSHFRRAWRGDQDSPRWLIETGRVHLDVGRYEQAREVFLMAALRDRENVDAVEGLGMAYDGGNRERGRRDLVDLLGNYGSGAGEQPARAEMNRWLAILHDSRLGDDEGLEYLEKAREIGGARAPILVELGRYWEANEDWDRARQLYGEALRVDPTLAEVHLGLARVATARDDVETAREHLEHLMSLVPVGEFHNQARARLDDLEEGQR